jgi:hypothetical protein
LTGRVYECNKSEVEELKKVLTYDPYLDPNLIPPSEKGSGRPADQMSAAEQVEMANRVKMVNDAIEKLGPKAKVIFSRQEYSIREGAAFGAPADVSLLYINASDEFLKGAEDRFKTEFKTIKRAPKEIEDKVGQTINEEQEMANTGLGSIFGS